MQIENGWVCRYGTINKADTCYQCTTGFKQNSSKTQCILVDYSYPMVGVVGAVVLLLIFIAKVNIAMAVLKSRYPHGLFMPIEFLQIFLLISIVGTVYPEDIMSVVNMLQHALFSFEFIRLDKFMITNYSYEPHDLSMKNLGFRSGLAIINIFNWAFILPTLMLINLLCYFYFERLLYHKSKGIILSQLRKFTSWLFTGIYIKFLNLSFVLLTLTSLREINRWGYYSKYQWSFELSWAILLL